MNIWSSSINWQQRRQFTKSDFICILSANLLAHCTWGRYIYANRAPKSNGKTPQANRKKNNRLRLCFSSILFHFEFQFICIDGKRHYVRVRAGVTSQCQTNNGKVHITAEHTLAHTWAAQTGKRNVNDRVKETYSMLFNYSQTLDEKPATSKSSMHGARGMARRRKALKSCPKDLCDIGCEAKHHFGSLDVCFLAGFCFSFHPPPATSSPPCTISRFTRRRRQRQNQTNEGRKKHRRGKSSRTFARQRCNLNHVLHI